MRILTVDPSKDCGWCHGGLEGAVFSGVLTLTSKQKSQRDLALLNFLVDKIRGNGITDVYVEKPIMPKVTSFQALMTLYGYATVVGLACAMTGANAYLVDMQSWRSEIGSPTQAPKMRPVEAAYVLDITVEEMEAGSAAAKKTRMALARRTWLKQATIDYIAKVYGIHAKTHDEADAVGIFLYARNLRLRKVTAPGFDFDKDLSV